MKSTCRSIGLFSLLSMCLFAFLVSLLVSASVHLPASLCCPFCSALGWCHLCFPYLHWGMKSCCFLFPLPSLSQYLHLPVSLLILSVLALYSLLLPVLSIRSKPERPIWYSQATIYQLAHGDICTRLQYLLYCKGSHYNSAKHPTPAWYDQRKLLESPWVSILQISPNPRTCSCRRLCFSLLWQVRNACPSVGSEMPISTSTPTKTSVSLAFRVEISHWAKLATTNYNHLLDFAPHLQCESKAGDGSS